MTETLRKVLEDALERLHSQVTAYLPAFLAAVILMLGAWIVAASLRWLIYRIFKGLAIDKFLRQSGLALMIDRSGRLRATRLVAESVYGGVLIGGALMGLSVFNTDLTMHITQGFVYLLPKLLVAGAILLAGAWLSQFLGRSVLVWSVNEGLPYPRRLAALVRILILFVAVVVVADQMNFARGVFLTAFVILIGGAVLCAALTIALGAAGSVRKYLDEKREAHESGERSLWSHL
jgi:hypothetical protein